MNEKNIHRIFIVGLIIKAFDAALEIIGGTIFLFTGVLVSYVTYLAQGELTEDPYDFIANHILSWIPYFSAHAQLYIALYLLSHGIVKIIVIICIIRKKLWSYPLMIGITGIFMVYQMYKLTHGYSLGFLILTLFDALIIILTVHEYRYMKRRIENTP